MNRSAQLLPFPDMKKDDGKEALEKAFEAFYQAYPKRIDKALARSKFFGIVKGGFRTKTLDKDSNSFVEIELSATPEELIEAAKRYTSSLIDTNTYKRKVEDKYIPSPAVWLNKGRFQD